MPKNGLIKVEAGAGLIINNDTLTNDCSQCFWGGIQAVGNSSLSQYVPGNQALVTIRNGSVIKNAINGVSNWDSTNTHSGGMIQASNSYFVNNMLALDFEPFENQSQSNSNIYPDMSYLSNCTFRVDSNYKGGISNHPFIGMAMVHGVYGLRYWGCQFLNENQDSFKGKGYGIYCMDGSVWLEPSCPGNVVLLNSSSCSNPIRNRFECLSRGIYVDASMSLDAASIIDQAVFDSCSIGVHVKTMNTVSVTRSSFLVGRGPPIVAFSDVGACNQNIGIYMQNSSQFRIEADTFNGRNEHSWGTLGYLSDWKNIGVAVDNSGKNDNTVYMNTFNGIDYGCYTRGPNSGGLLPPGPGSYAGLQFACNTFSNDTTDIHVSSFAPNNFNFTSINISQGSVYAATNNTFLSGGRIYNGGVPFEYYYDSMNVPQSLPTATNGNMTFYKSSAASCQSSFDVNNTTTAQRAAPTRLNTMKNTYYLNNDSLISDMDAYNALMDAGNADSLQYVMNHTSDPAVLNRIMSSVSPYLSSTSLEVLSHTTVLSHFTYFNILLSNPESLRGGGVIESLIGSEENPLSDIEANELDSVALTSTGRSLLEGHMSDVGRTRWGLAQDILRALKEDHNITGTCYTVTDSNSIWWGLDSNSQYVYFDSIGVWLQNIHTLWAQYAQVGYYSFLDPHDTSGLADSALLHAGDFFGLGDSASKDENVSYYVLWSILKEVRADNRNTDQLTDSERTVLEGIADSVGTDHGGQIAYSLAHNSGPYVRTVPPFPCLYYEGEEGKHSHAGGHQSNGKNQAGNPLLPVSNLRADCSLSVYPNPASSNVYFAYVISGNPENIALSINDAVGEEIKHFSLANKEGVVNLDIQGLKPGVYIYTMRDDKGVIGMGKIVVMN